MLISDIPTDTFNRIIADLRSDGWKTISEYDGIDAWIDYGAILLKQDSTELFFEWNNWWEGSIQGPDILLEELQEKYELK